TSTPMTRSIGARKNSAYFSAVWGGKSKSGALLPSSGGSGNKLKTNKSKLSDSTTLTPVAANSGQPDCAATTRRDELIACGAANQFHSTPMRINQAAQITR